MKSKMDFVILSILTIILVSGSCEYCYSQDIDLVPATPKKSGCSISIHYGVQMSGIKPEDFIPSNYSPLLNIAVHRRLSDLLSLHIGYKGYYFNYIMDKLRHYYTFIYVGLELEMLDLIGEIDDSSPWEVLIHSGFGIFRNNIPNKNTISSNIGIVNMYKLHPNLGLRFELSAIIGWDIYQGDWDILPSITIGTAYFFDSKSQ